MRLTKREWTAIRHRIGDEKISRSDEVDIWMTIDALDAVAEAAVEVRRTRDDGGKRVEHYAPFWNAVGVLCRAVEVDNDD